MQVKKIHLRLGLNLFQSVGLWSLDAHDTDIETRFEEFKLKLWNASKLIQNVEQNNLMIEVDEAAGRFESLERGIKIKKFQQVRSWRDSTKYSNHLNTEHLNTRFI